MNWQLVLGGGLQGLGQGISQNGLALRDARLKSIERISADQRQQDSFAQQDKLASENRQFQSDQLKTRQDFSASQSELDRQFRTEEAAKARDFSKPLNDAQIKLEEARAKAVTDPSLKNTSAEVQARKDLEALYRRAKPKQPDETQDQFDSRVANFMLEQTTHRSAMSQTDINAKAISAAQRDPDWMTASADERQALVDTYAKMLQRGTSPSGQEAPAHGGDQNSYMAKSVSRETTLQQARDAIAKGADPDKVKAILKQKGIDPSEL